MDVDLAIAVLVAITTSFGGWLTYHQKANDTKIRAAQHLIDNLQEDATTARQFASKLQGEADSLRNEINGLRIRQTALEIGVQALTNQLIANNIKPVWTPPPSTNPIEHHPGD